MSYVTVLAIGLASLFIPPKLYKVTDNSSFQSYPCPDDHTIPTTGARELELGFHLFLLKLTH